MNSTSKNHFCILLISIIYSSLTYSQTDTFMPLKLNNVFVYNIIFQSIPPQPSIRLKMKIVRDTIINNKKYYQIIFPPYGAYANPRWARVDSVTGSLLEYDVQSTCQYYIRHNQLDSLLSKLNDSSNICSYYPRVKCIDTSFGNIFGQNCQKKEFRGWYSSFPYGGGTYIRRYYKNIGLTYYSENHGGHTSSGQQWELTGCVINGVVYGDTLMPTGVQPVSNRIPDKFSLSQNYPNPFNPITKIMFDIPSLKKTRGIITKLSVYDALGREIAVLVNQELTSDTYEVEWDGSNYRSGVYFYRLVAGAYSETKKMVLVK